MSSQDDSALSGIPPTEHPPPPLQNHSASESSLQDTIGHPGIKRRKIISTHLPEGMAESAEEQMPVMGQQLQRSMVSPNFRKEMGNYASPQMVPQQQRFMSPNLRREMHNQQQRQAQILMQRQAQLQEARTPERGRMWQSARISPSTRKEMAAVTHSVSSLHSGNESTRSPSGAPLRTDSGHKSIPEAFYQYRALRQSKEIRLLRIEPGQPSQILVCSLCHTDIDSATEYNAISYAWGDKTATTDIICQNRRLKITRSLHDALQRIRHFSEHRQVWADAICINQDDKNEKGHQVRLMRTIFKKARKVLVWLGQDENQQAMGVFAVARQIFAKELSRVPLLDDPVWKNFSALFRRSWFWRVWCLQEVTLATSAEVLWGASSVPWECLGFAAAWIRTVEYQVMRDGSMSGVYNAYLMFSMSNSNSQPEPVSFLHLLTLTRQFEASDTRDRVYALLGLPTTDADPDNGELYMEPDYTKSSAEMFVALARKMILSSQGIRVLSAVQHGPDVEETLPSWVPQWNRLFTNTLAPAADLPVKNHAASSGLPESLPDFNGSLLIVHGLECDSITGVSAILPKSGAFPSEIHLIEHLWSSMAMPLERYPEDDSKNSLSTAFCWTITAGKDWYGMLVEDDTSHLADFAAFQRQYLLYPITSNLDTAAHNPDSAVSGDADRFVEAATNACSWRRFFVTQKGYMGIGPPCLREGDSVCVLSGGIVPFILRRTEPHYKLVGEAYVHGIMNGEACQQAIQDDLEALPFGLS